MHLFCEHSKVVVDENQLLQPLMLQPVSLFAVDVLNVEIWVLEDKWFPKALIFGLGKSVQKNLVVLLKRLYKVIKSNLI